MLEAGFGRVGALKAELVLVVFLLTGVLIGHCADGWIQGSLGLFLSGTEAGFGRSGAKKLKMPYFSES